VQTNTNSMNPGAAGGNILAGLFKDSDQGQRALADLKKAGYTRAEISGVGVEKASAASAPAAASAGATDAKFFREHDSSPASFESELTKLGFAKNDAHDLVGGITSGGAMVTVDAGADTANAMDILKRYKADVRSARSGAAPTPAPVAGNDTQGDREMQLRAERLQVDKQRVGYGEASVRKEVVTETQTIDVPVSHEELVIERHAVNSDKAGGTIGQNEEIRIPLSEERVNVSKSTVVTEEVEVGKRQVAGVERVSDTVRHEELIVDGQETRKR